jgi:hypothetical protein
VRPQLKDCHVEVRSVNNYDQDFQVAVRGAYASVVIAVLTVVENKFPLLIAWIFSEVRF